MHGSLRVPGDKSISHRAVMLASLAEGQSILNGFLEGEDSLATLRAFRQMGVSVDGPNLGKLLIHGVGLHGLMPPREALDLGNSGTSMRLLAGLMAGQAFDTTLIGDDSLMRRPMARVTEPLVRMGAAIDCGEAGRPPLKICGRRRLRGIEYRMPVASAQVKSCLLLAGLYADGLTRVIEPAPTRDHTERLLRGFGYAVDCDGPSRSLVGGGKLHATKIDIPTDISSAAFFLVAASIATGSALRLEHVGLNPTRIGVLNILRDMGADISVEYQADSGGEPVGDLQVRSAPLSGIEIPAGQIPLAIDEFPVLFVAAACAEGRTVLRGAEELRVKESDRIETMAVGLRALGINVETWPDGIAIDGGQLLGGSVDSFGDHRVAMAFAVAALRAEGRIRIRNCDNVATSFPGFVDRASEAGMRLEMVRA